MSWLTQSVTGRISQISGQLKDILTESTEDVLGIKKNILIYIKLFEIFKDTTYAELKIRIRN